MTVLVSDFSNPPGPVNASPLIPGLAEQPSDQRDLIRAQPDHELLWQRSVRCPYRRLRRLER